MAITIFFKIYYYFFTKLILFYVHKYLTFMNACSMCVLGWCHRRSDVGLRYPRTSASMWMLGTKPRSSVRTSSSLNLGALSSFPVSIILKWCVYVYLVCGEEGVRSWVRVSVDSRGWRQSPCIWSYRSPWAPCYRQWEPNSGPPEEQYIVLTTESPLQPLPPSQFLKEVDEIPGK